MCTILLMCFGLAWILSIDARIYWHFPTIRIVSRYFLDSTIQIVHIRHLEKFLDLKLKCQIQSTYYPDSIRTVSDT